MKDHFDNRGRAVALERNTRLEAVIREVGWTQEQVAARMRQIAAEAGVTELLLVGRSHIGHWLKGTTPTGAAPATLCEALSRGLGRPVTLTEIGLASDEPDDDVWAGDPLTALATLRDDMLGRRPMLFSALAAVVPAGPWWQEHQDQPRHRAPVSALTITSGHVDSLYTALSFFGSQDQRLGGRSGRAALRAYLATDVAAYLASRMPDEQTHRALLSAAGHLVYQAAWMDFDSGDHGSAQRNFALALTLAAEADDPGLAAHILRAQAHQAVDLGHVSAAVRFADASVDSRRYRAAGHRERALLGVVHARTLAAAGREADALTALARAEADLSKADPARDDDPARVAFFAEASLAHETGRTLQALGDLDGAERALTHSVRTRPVTAARTHAVTLGYLGAVQAQRGHIDAACSTWDRALDSMVGVQSGRTIDTVVQMRQALSPIRARGGRAATELDARAREFLQTVG